MLDWIGTTYDATPTPPPKPRAFHFFVNGCILGIALGMVTMCAILYIAARALATMP
jgi:hypothetical protein